MELHHLKIFVTVVETLDFVRAAEILQLHSQVVENAMHRLEEEVGVTLFYCFGRQKQLSLTKAGKFFYKDSMALLTNLDKACIEARRVHCGEAGVLSIAFSETAEFDLLPLFVHAFSTEYPLAQLRLLPMKSLDQVRALQNGSIQVGMLSLPSEIAGFSFRVIRTETMSIALPERHVLARERGSMRIQHVADQWFIMRRREADANFYDMMQQFFVNEAIMPRVRQEVGSIEEILTLVAGGYGIALIPDTKMTAAQGVVFRSLQSTNSALKTVLAWNKDNSELILQAFLKVADHVVLPKQKTGRLEVEDKI